MKYIIIFLLFSITTQAQTVGFQNGKFTINVNLSTTNITPSSIGNMERYDVRTGTTEGQGTLLMTYLNRTFFYFNASPAGTDITQTGTTGAWNIVLPTTPTTNKAIFIPDKNIVIAYSGTKYGFSLSANFFPVDIKLLVGGEPTGTLVCRIFSDGNVYWPNLSVRTPTAISTTGLTQYFIN